MYSIETMYGVKWFPVVLSIKFSDIEIMNWESPQIIYKFRLCKPSFGGVQRGEGALVEPDHFEIFG